ncbi:MAG: SRPBCC domain-containing protein [Gemmatimonadaceae bacterium]|nr:SRPBCC domain-containing protein [Gemmatimonadaceae bacterium]
MTGSSVQEPITQELDPMPHPTPGATPIRRSVHVAVEPARAFDLFTTHVGAWWNPIYSGNPTKAPIANVVLEARVGGRWYERGTDGSECEWARVLACEPPSRLLLDWHIAGQPTELEVTFAAPAPRRTDVTIVHRGFEAFGAGAERTRASHETSWEDLLERFAAEVAREVHARPESGDGPAPRAVTDGETVLATMDMRATPERIFRALTTSETEAWWGAPDTYQATAWTSDLRVGGRWSVDIRLADGSTFPAGGEYLEIDAPRRVVHTRRYDWDYPELGRRDTTVTYLLEPIDDGTRVTVRHDGFAGLRGPADHHVDGWKGFLQYLARYVDGETL